MSSKNIGSSFDDFLKEGGIYEETRDIAIKARDRQSLVAGSIDRPLAARYFTPTKRPLCPVIRCGRIRWFLCPFYTWSGKRIP